MTLLTKIRGAKSSRSGFTIIEVVVAMAVLTIAILGLIPMLAFNIKSNQVSKSIGYANFLAEQHLERVRAWPVYETTTVNGVTRLGIVSTNTQLIGTWDFAAPGAHDETFRLTAEIYHNGYTLGCTGGSTLFGGDEGPLPVDEGIYLSTYGPTLPGGTNTPNEPIVGDCTYPNYRGENFKVIRVTVSWSDLLVPTEFRARNSHSIQRQTYIAKF